MIERQRQPPDGSSQSPQEDRLGSEEERDDLPPGANAIETMRWLSGLFPKEDADEMLAAIKDGCENIDEDGW